MIFILGNNGFPPLRPSVSPFILDELALVLDRVISLSALLTWTVPRPGIRCSPSMRHSSHNLHPFQHISCEHHRP